MRPPSSALLLPTVLLVLGGLSACNGDPEPKIADPTSSSPSSGTSTTGGGPTNSPPPSDPPTSEPPDLTQETPAEFIRRFQAASFAMQNSGDSKEYRMMTKDCESCDNIADRVDSIYKSGGYIEHSGGRALSIKRVGEQPPILILEFTLKAKPSAIYSASGAVQERFGGGTARFQANIKRVDGTWRMLRLSELVAN